MDPNPEKLSNLGGGITVESRKVFSYPLHTHTYCEMILYEAFDGEITVGGKNIEVGSITAVLLSPLDFHQITVKDGACATYIKVGFNPDTPDVPPVATSLVLDGIKKDSFLFALFGEIRDHAKNTPYLTRLVGCAVHILLSEGKKILPLDSSKSRSIALDALKVINEEFREALSLSAVAQKLSVTPQYLSYAFKQGLGINFSQHLTLTRLKYAANRMLNTRESITDICFESGFENFSHFSRSFKRLYALSPREYRNKYSEK